jgi:hypothetical protein
VQSTVSKMSQADELAAAVNAALERERSHRWTLLQKIAAAVAGVLVALPALHTLLAWSGHG